jgi:phosphatidylglycerol:prolipoprotein diacylglycerol transferase
MYPYLPFGPLSVPTAAIFTIAALMLGMEIAGRYARRTGVHPDDIWNIGLVAILVGLIVARLWNVVQFWYIYRAEPLLIFSLRPSGFALGPGLVAALVAGYAYLLYKALDPVRVVAAGAVGALVAGALLNISHALTGTVVGTPTTLPWAINHFGELVHPVGLYRAAGLIIAWIAVWLVSDPGRPARTIWLALLGYSLVHLVADAFVADAVLIGQFRRSQVLALGGALLATLLLARSAHPSPESASSEQQLVQHTELPDHQSEQQDAS